jgi:hypothetical protein
VTLQIPRSNHSVPVEEPDKAVLPSKVIHVLVNAPFVTAEYLTVVSWLQLRSRRSRL